MDYYITKEKNRQCITEWYRARRNLFLLLCYESLLFGIEVTVLDSTEYFYYKNIMKISEPMICYSLALAVSIWSSLMASIFVSHILKRYQVYTYTMLILSLVSVIGYCLYFVTGIPAIAVLGRFLVGFGKASNIVSNIYVQHLYPEDELFNKMAILMNFVTIGTIIGPTLTFIFLKIDFNIGAVNLNYANSAGFYMFLCKLMLFVCAFFFMNDIPYQTDRNRFLYASKGKLEKLFCQCDAEEDENENFIQKFDADEEFIKEESEIDPPLQSVKRKIPLKVALYEIVSGNKALAVLLALCLHGVTFKIINSLLAVESAKYLKWSITEITGLYLGNAIFGTFASVVMAFLFTSSTHFLNLIGGMIFGLLSLVLMGTLPYYVINTVAANLLFCLMSLLNVLSSCLIGLSTRMIIEYLTDQKFRTFTDALRTCVLELSYFFGALLTMLVHLDLTTSFYVGTTVTLLTLMYVVFKLKQIWV